MRKLSLIILSAMAACAAISCTPKQEFANRAEKILAEIADPSSKHVVVVSHRGDWRNYPENSIPAIESVIRMGVDMVELDVKMTKDSVLVLMHDNTIDRMTNGKGRVSDITYDSLMTFKMRRAHNVVTDTIKVPTLRQALLCCKDRILVNVDHAYPYYKEIVALTEELGVTGQVLMKGKSSIEQVREDMSKNENNLLYMPIVDINKPQGQTLFSEYVESGTVPMAFEVCWQKPGEELDYCFEEIRKMGSRIWVNTLWPSLCGGFGNDDDAALADPAVVYGRHIQAGASMIQTDRPELLLNYLRSIGRHD
ncbi:MAG: glycerophosphodiester phosphodiesterase family protein [Bacteroidales bacterium]|nr:glycerophosphodiester phosphodiesterase family protein [Bacteroidales bacterium]